MNMTENYKIYDIKKENYFMFNVINHLLNFSTYDTIINGNKICNKLRKIEYDFYDYLNNKGYVNKETIIEGIKLNECLKYFNNCYIQLMNNISFEVALYQYNTFFYELHDRIVFYYNLMNKNIYFKKDDIRIINVNKHHHAVNYINDIIKEEELPSIITFDSHADMCSPYTGNYDKGYDGMFYDSVNNVGSVHIPIVLNYKKTNGIYWIVPDCYSFSYARTKIQIKDNLSITRVDKLEILKEVKRNDNELSIQSNFNISTNEYGQDIINKKSKLWIKKQEIENKNIENKNIKVLKYPRPIVHTMTNLDYFDFYNEISEKYILNIDLDYFISYGDKEKNDILNKKSNFGSEDQVTDNIYEIDFGFRNKKNKIISLLNNEIVSIRKKLDNFLLFIKKLKYDYNKIPKIIVLCDSSKVDFSLSHTSVGEGSSGEFDDNCMTNSYLPKRYSFWLRNTIIENIKEVLNEEYNFE